MLEKAAIHPVLYAGRYIEYFSLEPEVDAGAYESVMNCLGV